MFDENPPPIYKYLNVEGVRATLENQTFKWTKPAQFKAKYKDDMDMTVSKFVPEDHEQSLVIVRDNMFTILAKNVDRPLTKRDPHLAQIQEAFRNNPEAVNIVQDELRRDSISDIFNIDRIRSVTENFVSEINTSLQDYRVLCGTDNILSERMWQDYADDSTGAALRIEPSSITQKDSVFKLFRAVTYSAERPTFFSSTLEFLESSFFESEQELLTRTMDRIIYSKTNEYSYESEYRCILPLMKHEEHLGDIFDPYYAEEITGLYLGKNITVENKGMVIELAKRINPNISIYQIHRTMEGCLKEIEIR